MQQEDETRRIQREVRARKRLREVERANEDSAQRNEAKGWQRHGEGFRR